MSVKTDDFFLHDFNRAATLSTHLSIISIFPHTLSFPILYPSTSIMCFQTIPVLSQPRSKNTRRWQRNPANLRPISTSSTTPLSFSVGLWNCQSAVNKGIRPGFVQKTQQPQLLFLTISLSLTPQGKLAGVRALVCSFQTIGNTQPTLP